MIKKIAKYFELNKVLRKKIELLEEEASLQQDLLLNLEEENTKLKDTVVSSMDLVTQNKAGMIQMRQYMTEVMASQYAAEDPFNENEEEDELDAYKSLRKKTTIH